jgi:hypothetical protein
MQRLLGSLHWGSCAPALPQTAGCVYLDDCRKEAKVSLNENRARTAGTRLISEGYWQKIARKKA